MELGQPPAASPRTPRTMAAAADPRQLLLQVLSKVLLQFESDESFGQAHLDEDARISSLAQVRSFVHGHDEASVEPPVLCRLAQILRDDGQSEPAAVLYMQQIAELSHNHDYGHVTGKHGAVSEHDMLEMISSHVELCGLVKGRATTRHADEALRLATVLAGQKEGHLSHTRSRLNELAERLRQLRMAGQAARMGQQVARIDTAIKGQAEDINSQPWSKSNSRIPHAKRSAGGRRKPAQAGGYAPSTDLVASSGVDDDTVGAALAAAGTTAGVDRRALLKATSDMKEVLGLTQRVAELERLLANSEARAQAAEAMAAANGRRGVDAVRELLVERSFENAESRGCIRVVRSTFRAWAGGVQRGLRACADADAGSSIARAAAAEKMLVGARQQIFLMEQEQTPQRFEEQVERYDHLCHSMIRMLQSRRERKFLRTVIREWRKTRRNRIAAEHAAKKVLLHFLRTVYDMWHHCAKEEAVIRTQGRLLKEAEAQMQELELNTAEASKSIGAIAAVAADTVGDMTEVRDLVSESPWSKDNWSDTESEDD